jgi:hypothetical protein
MRDLITLIAVCCLCAAASAADPFLAFSDLASGPATGNGDTSRGQTAGQDGAIVTLWGRALGSTQGASSVRVNGVAARIYSWTDATAPANLSLRHQLQMVCFQIDHATPASGAGITVTVGGTTSNALPFTVRAGALRFVKTSGSDGSGTGSWSAPWRTLLKGMRSLAPGDICYIGDGVDQTTLDNYNAAVNIDSNGAEGAPKALVVYPGARSRIGSTSIERGFGGWVSNPGGYAHHWTIAKFDITGGDEAIYTIRSGTRVVGNRITAPAGDAAAGTINGQDDHLAVLGNELTQCGAPGCSKLYHPIYISSARTETGPRQPTETDREIAWNYLHDNNANRGINIYSEQATTAFMTNHRVHHNWIENQVGDGMLIGYYVTGENWIYDNVVVRAGRGPEPTTSEPVTHVGVQISAGHEAYAGTTIHFCNNTLYDCGWSGAASAGSSGMLLINNSSLHTLDFRNNIVVSTGQSYVAAWSDTIPTVSAPNIWFGRGAAPGWNVGALNVDPLFVSSGSNDYRLAAGSPAIDHGSDAHAFATIDFDATPRPQGAAFDLGAFEALSVGGTTTGTTSGTTTTGSSTGSTTSGGTGGDGGSSGGHCGAGAAIAAFLVLAFLRSGRRCTAER